MVYDAVVLGLKSSNHQRKEYIYFNVCIRNHNVEIPFKLILDESDFEFAIVKDTIR